MTDETMHGLNEHGKQLGGGVRNNLRALGYKVYQPADPSDCSAWTMVPPGGGSSMLAADEAEAWRFAETHYDTQRGEALVNAVGAALSRPLPTEVDQGLVGRLRTRIEQDRSQGGDLLYRGVPDPLLVEILSALTAMTSIPAEGWQDISTAPFNEVVEVQVGRMTFQARYMPDASIDEEERSCNQWQAEHEDEHPPCWSDGACWASNADGEASLQPKRWRPLPAPPLKE